MSKTKAELKARAAKAAQRSPRATDDDADITAPKTPTTIVPRAKPVRVTTDLDPQSYRGLLAYCANLAETLGRARVPHTEVIRALIDQLHTDDTLQTEITQSVTTRLSK